LREEKTVKIETKEFTPLYGSTGASGFDIQAYLPEEKPIKLWPGDRVRIPTELKMIIPDGYEVQLRSRSGLAIKHGIVILQGTATIDDDFRGEVGVLLLNVSKEPFTIEHGMRVCQGILAPTTKALFEIVPEITADTERGEGAYGSTGMK